MNRAFAWGLLSIFTLVFGFKLFVLGQTGSEMLRGVLLLCMAGFAVNMTLAFHKVATKEVNQDE